MKRWGSLVLGLATLVVFPRPVRAQQISRRWEIPGFDFSPNGVWRARARQVANARLQLLSRRDFFSLNAPLAGTPGAPGGAAATAVTGTLRVPAILLRYKDTNLAALRDTGQYSTVLFGALPPAGRRYTVRTFYE